MLTNALSTEAERRAYLGHDPAEIIADEWQNAAVRDALEEIGVYGHFLDGEPLPAWALEVLWTELYPWSQEALENG